MAAFNGRPLWQLLPRSLRPQLGPSAQLLQLQPGQLLPGSSHMPETSWLEAYFDISEIGQMTSIHRPGERILAAAKTEFVALKSADILVLDPAALLAASVEESMVMPAVPASKGCNKYSIKELFRLDKLLRQTEAFQHLDCRSMVDLCRSSALHFEALEPGQQICWEAKQICCEGQEATGFFAILEGWAAKALG
eukprot:Skav211852  [mRNA]  locus=scaffold1622:123714:133361:- [translate_table: standard]